MGHARVTQASRKGHPSVDLGIYVCFQQKLKNGGVGVFAAMLVGVLAGESPAGGTCPVAPVEISGGGAGDQSVGSPDVKVLVGWVKAWSAPTGGRANRQVVAKSEP